MRISIIGHFGGNENFVDGQTVKVKSLYNAIIKQDPISVDIVDTYFVMTHNIFKFLWNLLKCLLLDKKIIFLPAFRGRQYMFAFFYYIGLILHKDIYHDCIAGSLDQEIPNHKKWVKYLNSFKSNWMENPAQVEKLKAAGINNAVYVPNFKNINPLSNDDIITIRYEKPYRFCTFSRVEEMKGIEDALEAIQCINNKYGECVAVLDVYGPIQQGQETWFQTVISKYSDICHYKGVVPPDKSVEVLSDYFALLFPTRYYTEGMPGTIIDAMFAGIPVIARRWAWCDNMINNGNNGYTYDFNHPELLKEIIEDVINKPDKLISLKSNCLKEAEKYSESNVLEQIKTLMQI